MSTFLVTGGAGFIGSHIVDRLVGDGHKVRVIDNFSTGKMEYIQHNMDRIDLVRGDLVDLDTTRRACEGVDYILHQAALRSVPRSVNDPISTNNANVNGTLNLLVAARDAGVKRLVFASSSSVYGDNPALPKQEDMPPAPVSPYAVSKVTGEYYCRVFAKLYDIETVSLRYFNVFGPRQDPTSQYAVVIPLFIMAVLEGRMPVIFGDGLQSRDFTFVRNNVEANLLACSASDAVSGEVFNIACGHRYTLLEVLSAINQLLGKSIEPIFEGERAGDVKHTLGDISKAREMMGFEPVTEFMEGLEVMVRSMSDDYSHGR